MTAETKSPTLTLRVGARDHAQGPATAPVTLVEYGDYECPHCGRAYPIVKELQEHMGDELRFVFRNFPLNEVHPHAVKAAETAEAAGEAGKFWEMHDLLFEHQNALDLHHLVGYGTHLGMDGSRLASSLEAHSYAARVREDFMSGVKSGVNGTPTFFINGARYDGLWDLPFLIKAVKAAAAAAAHGAPGGPTRHR